jgi:hypothetical protein
VPAAVARLAPPGRRGAWMLFAAVLFVAGVLLLATRERLLRASERMRSA